MKALTGVEASLWSGEPLHKDEEDVREVGTIAFDVAEEVVLG